MKDIIIAMFLKVWIKYARIRKSTPKSVEWLWRNIGFWLVVAQIGLHPVQIARRLSKHES